MIARALDAPVERFVTDVTGALLRLADHAPAVPRDGFPRDAANEAFAIAAAFVDADGNHTDDELWALISAFAGRLDTSLASSRPDDLRKANLVAGHRRWIDQPSQLFALLVAADARRGGRAGTTGGDAWRYYEDAMALAHTVCAIDQYPSATELEALDRFRSTLLTAMEQGGVTHPLTGSPVRTATPPSEAAATATAVETAPPAAPQPLPPARPLEELLAELEGL